MRALFTAATGMEAQQTRIDTIANNLSNVTTTGFKKARAEFQDLFYDVLRIPGAEAADGSASPTGIQVGHGVKLAAVGRSFTQGDRVNTGRDFDLAIDGPGFFQIQRPDGETVYTRDGNFKLDSEGNVVSAVGYLLLPNLQVDSDSVAISISPDGTVNSLGSDGTPSQIGQVELVRFVNPAGLRALGGNLFAATDGSGNPETGTPDADGFGAIGQGFLESSNVNVAEELVQMILAQRSFEVNSRVIQTSDQMLQQLGTLGR